MFNCGIYLCAIGGRRCELDYNRKQNRKPRIRILKILKFFDLQRLTKLQYGPLVHAQNLLVFGKTCFWDLQTFKSKQELWWWKEGITPWPLYLESLRKRWTATKIFSTFTFINLAATRSAHRVIKLLKLVTKNFNQYAVYLRWEDN